MEVPAGIADGQRIRLGGRGHAGELGAPAGDLYVLVRVREHERFMREGDDLITALDVAAPVAALGGTLEVPTLDGNSVDRAAGRHTARRGADAARRGHAGARSRPARRPARGRQRASSRAA